MILVSERAKTVHHALDRTAIVTGSQTIITGTLLTYSQEIW
jgi:hypothetical protein